MKKIIFALIGEMASGKETVKQYLEKQYQAKSCRFSSIVRDILDRLYLEQSRDNLQNLSSSLRQVFGQDILARTIAKEVANLDSTIIIVDGVRRPADIKYLSQLDNFYLIAIQAEINLRYQRLLQRAENEGDANKSLADFLADHQKEAEREIPQLMSEADFTLNNNGGFEELYQQVDKIMKKVQND